MKGSDIQADIEQACPLPSSGRSDVCSVTSLGIWSASAEPESPAHTKTCKELQTTKKTKLNYIFIYVVHVTFKCIVSNELSVGIG